jgi:hypothetical protein
MKKILLILVLAVSFRSYASDSLTIYLQGLKPGEKYKVYLKGYLIGDFQCKKKSCTFQFKILDEYENGEPLGLRIYRKCKMCFSYKDTYFGTFYDSKKKYLIIYRNEKLKNKYAIEPLWKDEILKFR